jgi:hypothetical protein
MSFLRVTLPACFITLLIGLTNNEYYGPTLTAAQRTTEVRTSPCPQQSAPGQLQYRRFQASGLVDAPPLSVIPGMRGFGTTTVAGSGRQLDPPLSHLYKIKTLADSGPGSLRECVNLPGPRTCLFEISGEIPLLSVLRIRSPYITIAGQTAPHPGITITHSGLSIETHDVLIQHLAIRPGDYRDGVAPRFRDGISIGAPPPHTAHNIVLDHLSLTWALDENLSTAYEQTHDVTVANSLIAEGLHDSIHPKGPHSKGVMIGNNSERVTLYRNILAANHERNPYIKPGTSVEMLNNIVYGWGAPGGWSLCNLSNNDGTLNPVQLTFIGNIYIPGPWSFIAPPIYAKQLARSSRIYVRDNKLLVPNSSPSDPWGIAGIDEETFRADSPPVESPGVSTISTDGLQEELLTSVGSRPARRSQVDRRIIDDIKFRKGSIKDCLRGCPNAAAEGPSFAVVRRRAPLPIARKTRPLRLPADPLGDRDQDGYTNLENWLHLLLRVVE